MTYGSDRVNSLPPYLFSMLGKRKQQLMEDGVDVIDLGVGAPDLPTPQFIVKRLIKEVSNPDNHRYSSYAGCQEFRQAVATFYKNHYQVDLNPDTEILTLIGSKEGIAHFISASINPGDAVLIPDPGYPVYQTAVHLAGGKSVYLKLDQALGYAPNFAAVSALDLQRAKLLLLNYPSNPTAATATIATFSKAISFASRHDLTVVHDAAYHLVTFDAQVAPSMLQVPGAKERGVEFGSLSKSFNMTGWRIGYVAGNKDMIKALSTLKSHTDTSQFLPIQKAAASALLSDLSSVHDHNRIYQQRMITMVQALKKIGIDAPEPKATFFIWAPVPEGFTSMKFAEILLENAGVIVTPGSTFGPSGEGYFRISLSVDNDRLQEAARRIVQLKEKGWGNDHDDGC